jgi:hypothetical protein
MDSHRDLGRIGNRNPSRPSPESMASITRALAPAAANVGPMVCTASTLSVASSRSTLRDSASARLALSSPTMGLATNRRATPASAKASASPSLATHSPCAPRAICRRPTSAMRWVLACG